MTDTAQPNTIREAKWASAPAGRPAGTMRLEVIESVTGAVILGDTAATETVPGVYSVSYLTPRLRTFLLETWSDTVIGISSTYGVEVVFGSVYANVSDFRAYAAGPVNFTDDELFKVVSRAERQINGYLKWGVTPYTLESWAFVDTDSRAAVRDAVCAQTEYRLVMGEEFFIETPTPISGPDYTNSKTPPTIGPKARQELLDARIISSTGTFTLSLATPSTRERRFSGWY